VLSDPIYPLTENDLWVPPIIEKRECRARFFKSTGAAQCNDD